MFTSVTHKINGLSVLAVTGRKQSSLHHSDSNKNKTKVLGIKRAPWSLVTVTATTLYAPCDHCGFATGAQARLNHGSSFFKVRANAVFPPLGCDLHLSILEAPLIPLAGLNGVTVPWALRGSDAPFPTPATSAQGCQLSSRLPLTNQSTNSMLRLGWGQGSIFSNN